MYALPYSPQTRTKEQRPDEPSHSEGALPAVSTLSNATFRDSISSTNQQNLRMLPEEGKMTNSPLVLPPLSNCLASPLKKESEFPVPFEPSVAGTPASYLMKQAKSIEQGIAEREEKGRLTLTLH